MSGPGSTSVTWLREAASTEAAETLRCKRRVAASRLSIANGRMHRPPIPQLRQIAKTRSFSLTEATPT